MTELVRTVHSWRKSSRSNGGNGNCVEVGSGDGVMGVRDSKNPAGGVLLFVRRDWDAFLGSL